jgi:hypothetical protein
MKPFSPTQKGLITGLLMITASVFSLFVLKNPIESDFQFVVYGIFTLGLAWSLVALLKQDGAKKGFGQYFSIGFKTFVVVALLMAVFAYIYFSYNTAFRDTKIAENSRLLLAEGNHLPQEVEANAAQLKKMFMPMMISAAMFRYLILGAIITSIGALLLSKKTAQYATKESL